MNSLKKMRLAGFAMFLALAAAGPALADGGMSKDALDAAEERIEKQAKAAAKACGALKGNAKDICQAEAKGREKVARAQLEAQYAPGPETEREAKDAKAEADYAVAKERCDDARSKEAKKTCLRQAKSALEAAVRLAKVEKVENINELKAKAEKQRKAAAKAAAATKPASAA